jgi:hypothetical protein
MRWCSAERCRGPRRRRNKFPLSRSLSQKLREELGWVQWLLQRTLRSLWAGCSANDVAHLLERFLELVHKGPSMPVEVALFWLVSFSDLEEGFQPCSSKMSEAIVSARATSTQTACTSPWARVGSLSSAAGLGGHGPRLNDSQSYMLSLGVRKAKPKAATFCGAGEGASSQARLATALMAVSTHTVLPLRGGP